MCCFGEKVGLFPQKVLLFEQKLELGLQSDQKYLILTPF